MELFGNIVGSKYIELSNHKGPEKILSENGAISNYQKQINCRLVLYDIPSSPPTYISHQIKVDQILIFTNLHLLLQKLSKSNESTGAY